MAASEKNAAELREARRGMDIAEHRQEVRSRSHHPRIVTHFFVKSDQDYRNHQLWSLVGLADHPRHTFSSWPWSGISTPGIVHGVFVTSFLGCPYLPCNPGLIQVLEASACGRGLSVDAEHAAHKSASRYPDTEKTALAP